MPRTLKNQLADDAVNVFANQDEFAESATYVSPVDGAETPITIIPVGIGEQFGEALVEKMTPNGNVQYRRSIFAVLKSEVANPLVNGRIVVNSERWPIVGRAGEDSAMIDVVCELPVSSENVRRDYRLNK